jgi:FtsZ-binding cell division protein ZapB
MAIDNPFDAIEKAYPERAPQLPTDLALLAAKFALPGIVTDVLGTVCERLDRNVQEERAKATIKLLAAELKDLKEKTASKEELNDLREAIQLSVRHDVEEFNDRKRERYIKIIGNALRSTEQVDDLASYIQDVERLGERDLVALKVLNRVMNPARSDNTKDIHPNEFIHRRQELAVEMARALGGAFEGPSFSREEGYDACNRLQGFGLAHEIELSARQVPVGEYCFRPSRRGLMLLKLVGEEVANADKYHL